MIIIVITQQSRRIASLIPDRMTTRTDFAAWLTIQSNNNGRNGSCLTWLATSLEEKRRWLVINASPRGQCSK